MTELLQFILDHEAAFQSTGRLASLYSDFRLQAVINPDGYSANISAWRKALTDAARAGVIPAQAGSRGLLTIPTGEELIRALESKQWGRPLALGSVIQDAVQKKELILIKDFLSSTTSIYHKSWVITPRQVVAWMLRQVGFTGTSQDRLVVGHFVSVANVEAAADAILRKQESTTTSTTSTIYSLSTFTSTFAHALHPSTPLSPTDISILLTHLSRDRAALAYDPASQTIKFKPDPTLDNPPEPVTANDTALAALTTLLASLQTQTQHLATRTTDLGAEARDAVAKGNTTGARTTLRRKRLAETTLAQRGDALARVEEVLAEVERAAGQVEVVKALQAGTGVLKGLQAEVGGVEEAERVVEGWREEVGKVEEVSGVLAEVGGEGVDEGEVEGELEALEREEREKVEAEETKKRLEALEEVERKRREEEEARMQRESKEELATGTGERQNKGVVEEDRQKDEVKEETPVRQIAEQVGELDVDANGKEATQPQSVPAVSAESS
ncbi:MAG: hypothetical protein M1822_007101 [Bathelium mastoideum]|nr:MAG: hypothetical protein M1822_007101 [Bathelium mastoideum]